MKDSIFDAEKTADYGVGSADKTQKIPENQESASPLGIQKEFRKANEEECGIILSMTDHKADKLLADLE